MSGFRTRVRRIYAVTVQLVLAGVLSSCTSTPPEADRSSSDDGVVTVPRFYWKTLRFRRPLTARGDERANGDAARDCVSPEMLFRSLNLPALAACLDAVKTKSFEGSLRLRREDPPYLEWAEPDAEGGCLRALLQIVPVPREVFFQAADGEGRVSAFATTLDLEADEVLYIKAPWLLAKRAARLRFPAPVSDPVSYLSTVVLSVYFAEAGGARSFPARRVPDAIARRCIGPEAWIDPAHPELPGPEYPQLLPVGATPEP